MPLKTTELKNALVNSGRLSEDDFNKVRESAKQLNSTVGQVLIGKGLFSEDELGKYVAESYNVEYVDLGKEEIQPDVLLSIPKEIASEKNVIVFDKGRGVMKVAMSDPSDLETIDYLRKSTGYNIKVFYSFEDTINKTLRDYQKDIKQVFLNIIEENAEKSKGETGRVEDVAKKVPVVKVLDTIMEYAVSEEASDIHIEPLEEEVLVRYRVDGQLRDVTTLPKELHQILVARVKILAELKIDEHRLPQDGRIKTIINNSKVSLRVSIMPIFFGEKIVMRVLEESSRRFSLEDLGILGVNLEITKRNITKPHGMVLVTGPTGSGKTTTLYTILSILNTTNVNINTIEDPIEYSMPRINQTQVNPKVGLTFASGLRSLLRQDPDIIMVGEIRDKETVGMAVNAAMTGHLVLSTLHTNSAAGAIPRMLDMGVEPFLAASTLNVVLAQRLIRRLCDNCKKQYKIPADLLKSLKDQLKKLGISPAQVTNLTAGGKFYQAGGCKRCGGKGFRGRIGIYEALEVSPKIMTLIVENATSKEIQSTAMKEGMVTMLQDGILKARDGCTTIEEVLAATKE